MKMKKSKISFTLLLTLLTAIGATLPVGDSGPFGARPVLAQSQGDRKAEADRIFKQGLQQGQSSQFQAAISSWQAALKIYRNIGDRSGERKSLNNLGIAYHSLGQYQKAIEYFQQSLEIAREIGDISGEGNLLNNLGSTYNSLGEYQRAIEDLQQSLQIYRKIGDSSGKGTSLKDLGNAYNKLGEYQKAIEYLQLSLQIFREIGDRSSEGESLSKLGLAYFFIEQYERAIEYHQQSLKISREIGDRSDEGISLGNLGNAYNKLGKYPKAIEYYQQSLQIFREIGNRSGEGSILNDLGAVYIALEQEKKAIEYLQQSLQISREIGDRESELFSLYNFGSAYYFLEQYQRAVEYYQQSLQIFQEIGDRGMGDRLGVTKAEYLRLFGEVYLKVGQYQRAIEFFQQSLEIAREMKSPLREAAVLNSFGLTYNSLGQYRRAIEYYQQSLQIAREIGERSGEGTALMNLGIAYRDLKQYRRAIEYFQQSLQIAREIESHSGEGYSLLNLGIVYSYLGQYQQAIEYLQQSLQIFRELGDRYIESTSLSSLGNVHLMLDQYQRAIEYYQQSLEIDRTVGNRYDEGNYLNSLGLALFKSGNLPEAEKTLFEALEILESIRANSGGDTNKVSIFERYYFTYRNLQHVLIRQNKVDTALEISERGRARAFVELLASRLASDDKTIYTPLTLEEIKRIAQAQNATIVQYSHMYDNFKVKEKYEMEESELYIWVIKPTGEISFRKADLKPLWQEQDTFLAKVVAEARCFGNLNCQQSLTTIRQNNVRVSRNFNLEAQEQAASTTNSQPQNSKLQQLHQLLIDPIADLLPKDANARVIFVPQGSLFLVPFPALQDEAGKYLIEKHTILTAPSIQVLDLTRKQGPRTESNSQEVLVVGNPTMPKVSPFPGEPAQQLSPLPGAEKEAIEIARMFNSKALIGKAATESAVVEKMKSARIIHLSTHGTFDPFRGIGSWIALAPEGENDGLLLAEEIFDMKLNAELVVLSACDTGRGKITGDGVLGLSRSLISAGVPSVLVSLWKVPDRATQELMIEFYNNWQKHPDKGQALRQAMLTMMKKYPDAPEKWAAFTLIGEGSFQGGPNSVLSIRQKAEAGRQKQNLLAIVLMGIGIFCLIRGVYLERKFPRKR